MSNSRELAKAARTPLEIFAREAGTPSPLPEAWAASQVDDMVANLMADLLHYAATYGRRNVDATLELVKVFYDDEHQAVS